MQDLQLGAVERRFADLIWENEPISSGALVQLCQEALGWKKSTTYTVLRRLCDRGLFENNGGTVTSRLTKEAFQAKLSEQFVAETFEGSLPKFLAAFSMGKQLSAEEIEQLQQLIAQWG